MFARVCISVCVWRGVRMCQGEQGYPAEHCSIVSCLAIRVVQCAIDSAAAAAVAHNLTEN